MKNIVFTRMRACLWKLYMRHFSICFLTVVGLQFWTLSCKFPSHQSRYFFFENLHIKFVFSVYLIFGMLLVPRVGRLLSPFSPLLGFFPLTDPWAGAAGVNVLFWLQPLLAVDCLPIIDHHNSCSHRFVFFPGWRVKILLILWIMKG